MRQNSPVRRHLESCIYSSGLENQRSVHCICNVRGHTCREQSWRPGAVGERHARSRTALPHESDRRRPRHAVAISESSSYAPTRHLAQAAHKQAACSACRFDAVHFQCPTLPSDAVQRQGSRMCGETIWANLERLAESVYLQRPSD